MPVEILEVLVVMEGHVADGMALALLVGGIHNRVGGVREVDEVATIFKRLHNLTIYMVDSQLQAMDYSPASQSPYHNHR